MSNWVDDEGEKFNREREEKERRAHFIAASNFWASLLERLKEDVQSINDSGHWAAALKDAPLNIEKTDEGILVIKPLLPAVFLSVANQGDHIEVKYQIIKTKGGNPATLKTERLAVESDGKTVFLNNGIAVYVIPAQASQYILSYLINHLREQP